MHFFSRTLSLMSLFFFCTGSFAMGAAVSLDEQAMISILENPEIQKICPELFASVDQGQHNALIESLKIVALCTGAAVVYGTLQDQITARVCKEYFTSPMHQGHYNFLRELGYMRPADLSATQVAFIFGFCATWWVGAGLGTALAISTQAGSLPKLTVQELFKPIAFLFATTGVCSVLAGCAGYVLTDGRDLYRRFEASGYAHNTAYLVSIVGGLSLIGWILWKRLNKSVDVQIRQRLIDILAQCEKSGWVVRPISQATS